MPQSLHVFRIDWPKLSCICTRRFWGFVAGCGGFWSSFMSSKACSFKGIALGDMARLGGEDGGVDGGTFWSEKMAKSADGGSDETKGSSLSSSTMETHRRLRVSLVASWCFLFEHAFEYVLRGGLGGQSQYFLRDPASKPLTYSSWSSC